MMLTYSYMFFSYTMIGLFTFLNTKQYFSKNDNLHTALEKTLEDSFLKEKLKMHLAKEFNAENLEFIESARRFKDNFNDSLNSDRARLQFAWCIYSHFISENSPFQVNLSGSTRETIVEKIEKSLVSRNMYDKAEKEVFTLLKNDSFRRFSNINGELLH
ncbi:positive regulation of GTPase activity [Bonamia ostreae]|uniref:Positive regulation of GTPase activity n=1 Tax=Bonamia ostreae TaxID=126728 RepID=A0ABV2AUG7_9EUKA